MTVNYKTLRALHPSINLELTKDRKALYEGIAAVKPRAARFLHTLPNHPDVINKARLERIECEPHAGSVIQHFSSMLFKSPPTAVPTRDGRDLHGFETAYYGALKENCDRAGQNVEVLFKELWTDAAVTGRGWLKVCAPEDVSGLEPPVSKADFEARRLGALWLEKLDYSEVLDWELDPDGNLELVIVHKISEPRPSVSFSRDRVIETFEVWSKYDCEKFQISYIKNEPPKADDVVPSIELKPHYFGCVPIFCLEFGPSQHLMAKLEGSQIAHIRSLSAESWALGLSAYAQLLLQVADPQGFTAPIMSPDVGIILGKDDTAKFLEPSGVSFDALNRKKLNDRDAIYKIGSAMALGQDNSASSVGRSAESKAIDHEASRIALRAWADPLKEIMQRAYSLIASVRGESVVWRIDGCDDADLVAYLECLKLLRDGLDGPVHSPQARAAMESRAVEALLPDATLQERDVWRKETLAAILSEPTPEQRSANELAALHAAVAGNDQADSAA